MDFFDDHGNTYFGKIQLSAGQASDERFMMRTDLEQGFPRGHFKVGIFEPRHNRAAHQSERPLCRCAKPVAGFNRGLERAIGAKRGF